LFGSSSLGN
jgi:tetratricopeptide (TPR) repeat protein